jgi:allantoicase
MSTTRAVVLGGLVDLAAARLGGRALATSDEFFAEASNLLEAGRGLFVEGKFTERGKWMDGWESRRRRGPGHDWCIVELGVPGHVVGFDIDTNHFVGNAPQFASVDGVRAKRGTPLEALGGLPWSSLLGQSALVPGSQNLFAAIPGGEVSHVRLNIFPDGGVARFRVFGRVEPAWDEGSRDDETASRVAPGAVDLAAVTSGGVALACSDAFFGGMNNLLMPGRAENMGDGWETRRRRGPGHDWILVRLGARGIPACVEVDTNHFLGNCPDRCSIDWIDAGDTALITDLLASSRWETLLPETKLTPHTRHFFDGDLVRPSSPPSHLRLNIYPDGGVSRLRVWGPRR